MNIDASLGCIDFGCTAPNTKTATKDTLHEFLCMHDETSVNKIATGYKLSIIERPNGKTFIDKDFNIKGHWVTIHIESNSRSAKATDNSEYIVITTSKDTIQIRGQELLAFVQEQCPEVDALCREFKKVVTVTGPARAAAAAAASSPSKPAEEERPLDLEDQTRESKLKTKSHATLVNVTAPQIVAESYCNLAGCTIKKVRSASSYVLTYEGEYGSIKAKDYIQVRSAKVDSLKTLSSATVVNATVRVIRKASHVKAEYSRIEGRVEATRMVASSCPVLGMLKIEESADLVQCQNVASVEAQSVKLTNCAVLGDVYANQVSIRQSTVAGTLVVTDRKIELVDSTVKKVVMKLMNASLVNAVRAGNARIEKRGHKYEIRFGDASTRSICPDFDTFSQPVASNQ